jgi:PAS domain S-box-containing protein
MEIREAMREERQISVLLLNFRKDGQPFWNAFTLAPIKDASGIVEYYIGIQVDVTEFVGTGEINEEAVKAVAKEELEQARQLARDVMQNHDLIEQNCRKTCGADRSIPTSLLAGLSSVAGAFVMCDPKLPDLPMVFCSPGFLELTGYTCVELLGRNCRMLQGPGTDPEARKIIKESLAAKKAFTVSILNYKKDGTPFNNCLHIAPVRDADGQVKFFCGVQLELGEGRSGGRSSAAGEDAMLTTDVNGNGANGFGMNNHGIGNGINGDSHHHPLPVTAEATGMQILQQKGTVGAVRVAVRSLSTSGLRRSIGDQYRPGAEPGTIGAKPTTAQ